MQQLYRCAVLIYRRRNTPICAPSVRLREALS